MKTFAIHTLGCKVNAFESQGYAKGLKQLGYQEVDFDAHADIYIINTCTVTNTAASKSRQKIHKAKRENPNSLICIVGCFAQTDANIDDLGVDVIVGSQNKNKLPEIIDDAYKNHCVINDIHELKNAKFESIVIDEFENKTRAFIKIQDGCNQFCSYCIIPYARGRQRSMPFDDVISQVKLLVKNHKEIVLTGIHTGRYGEDIGFTLTKLLQELVKIEELERIRLSSIEINEITDELIELMVENEKIARNLHIPVQSCCNKTLKMMNRPYTIDEFIKRVKYIRSKISNISISTDIILGFPDETDLDFEETLSNLELINFSFMHIFPYSKRDGTMACNIKNHLPNKIKKERCSIVDKINKKGYFEYKKGLLNTKLDVLFEYYKDGFLFGHSSEYVEVKVSAKNENLVNNICKVKIIDLLDDGILVGEMGD